MKQQILEQQVQQLTELVQLLLKTTVYHDFYETEKSLQSMHPTYMGRPWDEILNDILSPSGGMVDTSHSKCDASRRSGSSPLSGTRISNVIVDEFSIPTEAFDGVEMQATQEMLDEWHAYARDTPHHVEDDWRVNGQPNGVPHRRDDWGNYL